MSVFILILGLFGAHAGSAEDVEYAAIANSLVVTTGAENFERRLARFLDGKAGFDDMFRDPRVADGGRNIHCAKAYKIGVLLTIRRSSDGPLNRRNVHIRYEWTHEYLDVDSRWLTRVETLTFSRRQTKLVDLPMREVAGKAKQDGRWTLRSYIAGDLLTEESFNLIDCEGRLAHIDIRNPPEPEMLAALEAFELLAEDRRRAEKDRMRAEEEALLDEVVCREQKPTGSRIKQTVCRSGAEAKQIREAGQEFARDVQSTPSPPRQ